MRDKSKTENFAELLAENLANTDWRLGAVVKATIVDIKPEWIVLSAGLKSDAMVSKKEFEGEEVNIGDEVDVVVKSIDNYFGQSQVSHQEALQRKVWDDLETAHENETPIKGQISEIVKGGFKVSIKSVVAFLPGSLVDVKPVRDTGYLEDLKGQELEFKIIKLDRKRNNVVVSRRAVMQETSAERIKARLDELQEGQEIIGVVKNITDYGAFVDLGGVDGLLHITDMAWKRVKHPSDLLTVGEELKVKILKFDRDKNRVSLGLKQLGEDPWENIARRYPKDTRMVGRITNITDYGCFVEIEEGVEGLVHMSEMDWTNKNIHPSKVVKIGDEVEVMVLEIDEERRRISLGIKQCKLNPWQEFAESHQKDERITGKIRSITDFGLFVGLEGEIDGLVHLSDISWSESAEEAVRKYQKGDEVEAIILSIDPARERISLGIKQLEEDPIAHYVEGLDVNAVIKAKVLSVDTKQAVMQLAENIEGQLRIADYTHDRVKDLREELKAGEEVEVKMIHFDRKTRQLHVSHKVLEKRPEDGSTTRKISEEPTKTTLGDLLKEQMKKEDE